MKAMPTCTLMQDRGFTVMELVVVVGIISILLIIAGVSGKQYMDRYRAESQIRTMHADLMHARVKAMDKNRQYFVAVNADSYQVIEDTNENSVVDAPPDDTWQTLTALNSPVSSGTGTIIVDQRGIISTATSTQNALPPILFNTGSAQPEYNCIQLFATRITIGRINGADCDSR